MDSKGCPDYIAPAHVPVGTAQARRARPMDKQGAIMSMAHGPLAAYAHACARHVMRTLALCVCLLMLGACQAQGVKPGAKAKPPRMGQTVWLTLNGYNYTDHYMDNYYVNGAWGGNVFISDASTGGSKYTCCVRWIVGQRLPVKVRVRWESSACVYTKHVDGVDFERAKQYYSELDVTLSGPIPADPQYFETHFYPDGHVEVAVTSGISPPRLIRPALKNGLRPGAKPWPKCTPAQIQQGEG